ncbi:hypothetical protein, partial [Microseira sp. BLCC-F43]|uniref:hypothetical protein n=1 Tax=Microseira sp. BLCC-F43 TaxID=3153602 RepID=UPI0035B70311
GERIQAGIETPSEFRRLKSSISVGVLDPWDCRPRVAALPCHRVFFDNDSFIRHNDSFIRHNDSFSVGNDSFSVGNDNFNVAYDSLSVSKNLPSLLYAQAELLEI